MIVPPGMENIVERFHYAPGIVIGDTLYASGQVGRDENLTVVEDPEAQYEQYFRNIAKLLDAAGFTFADIVELQTWFVEVPDYQAIFRRVKDRWMPGPLYPTWTNLVVGALAKPGLICEIKITAVRDPA